MSKSITNMTLKEIAALLVIEKEQAKEIKDLITYKSDPEKYTSVQKWISQCFNMPSKNELIMEALNEIIEGYGSEAIFNEDYSCSWPLIEYVNMGDMYTFTVMRLADQDKWIISTWDDIIEYYERKGYRFN